MTTSPRVIFFGNEQLCTGIVDEKTPLFDSLITAGYDIAAVVVRPDAPKGRSRQLVPALVKQKAIARGITVIQPENAAALTAELRAYSGCVGVLAAFGMIVPQAVIDMFEPYGIINIHPSLLPAYRGSSPIEATILHGDNETGVSLMRLVAGMDEGPLLAQARLTLTGRETKFELYNQLVDRAIVLLRDSLVRVIAGAIEPAPQQTTNVSYTTRIQKTDGYVDPTTETADSIERKVRAYLGYPKTRVSYDHNDVFITSCISSSEPSTHLPTLSCKDGHYIHILELIAENGKHMSGDAYLRGHRSTN